MVTTVSSGGMKLPALGEARVTTTSPCTVGSPAAGSTRNSPLAAPIWKRLLPEVPTGGGLGSAVAGGGVPGGGGKADPEGFTVTVTWAGAELAVASLTTSEKTSVTTGAFAATAGAEKVGWAVAAPESETAGPTTCVQAYVKACPSGSALALPSSVTAAPEATA